MTANVTKKVKITGTVQELIGEYEKQFPLFKKHFFNFQEQQRQYRMCVENLKPYECAILVDFSENYDCKLSEEVQALHFGGSKNSITLHTGMIYTCTQCQSFVTLSDSNCHEPHAIWAHLIPIIKLAKQICPALSVIHFFSDGPTSQYRQKKNFFLLNLFTTKLNLSLTTWSFSESGHGKGVADGIGGATKRALDRRVYYGHDIVNATDAFNNLKTCMKSVKPFLINNSDIDNIKTLVPSNLKAIVGTMQIHQIISTVQNEILHRQLSCFCKRGQCACLSPIKHCFLEKPNSGSSSILRHSDDPHISETESIDVLDNFDIHFENTTQELINSTPMTDFIEFAEECSVESLIAKEPSQLMSILSNDFTTAPLEEQLNEIAQNISLNWAPVLDKSATESVQPVTLTDIDSIIPNFNDVFHSQIPISEDLSTDIYFSETPSDLASDTPKNNKMESVMTETTSNDNDKAIPSTKRIKIIEDISYFPKKRVKTLNPVPSNPLKPININKMSTRTFYCTLCKTRKAFKLHEMINCLICKTWNCISCSGPILSESYICVNCLKH